MHLKACLQPWLLIHLSTEKSAATLLTSLLSKVLSSVRGNTDMGQWPYYLNIADKLSVKIGNKNAKPQDYLKNTNKSKFNLKETTYSTVIPHSAVPWSSLPSNQGTANLFMAKLDMETEILYAHKLRVWGETIAALMASFACGRGQKHWSTISLLMWTFTWHLETRSSIQFSHEYTTCQIPGH